jgi:hypothetical protein
MAQTLETDPTAMTRPTTLRLEGELDGLESPRHWLAPALVVLVLVGEFAWIARRTDPLAEQRRAVAALLVDEKATLDEHWERFRKLSLDDQQRLRDLHAAIEQDADPNGLRTALVDYEKWKATLSSQDSASLIGLDPQPRIARVKELADEQSAIAAKTLSPADVRAIIAWLQQQVEANREKLLATLPQGARERLDTLGVTERNTALMMSVLMHRGPGGPRRDFIGFEEWAQLKSSLSPQAQKTWDAAPGMEARKLLIGEWIRQAMLQTYPQQAGGHGPRVDEAELKKFFNQELDDAERNRLLGLPGDEMTVQLRREYLRRRGLWREPAFGEPWRADGTRPDFSPDGPGRPGGRSRGEMPFAPGGFGRKPVPPDR